MRLMYFMLTVTQISCASRWRIYWVLGAALGGPPQCPPSLDTGVEAGLEGSDILGLPRDGAEAGSTGAEPR
jgi:hypothetical protein